MHRRKDPWIEFGVCLIELALRTFAESRVTNIPLNFYMHCTAIKLILHQGSVDRQNLELHRVPYSQLAQKCAGNAHNIRRDQDNIRDLVRKTLGDEECQKF